MMNSIENDMMGVMMMISTVNFQLIKKRKIRLPTNWIRLRRSIEILSEAALSTTLTSLVNLDISYPVLFLS